MKDIDIVASMFEEIKKSLEKLSKQKPSSQPTAETLSEDIISLKKILKLIFDMQTKLYEAQQELPNALKQSITVKVQQPKYFWWLVLVGFLLSCSVSLNFSPTCPAPNPMFSFSLSLSQIGRAHV